VTATPSASSPTNASADTQLHQPDRLLRLPQVQEIVALGKSMIYRLISERRFPQPLKLCGKASRWRESEIFAWVAEQTTARH
jgi:prophage regulatory protein